MTPRRSASCQRALMATALVGLALFLVPAAATADEDRPEPEDDTFVEWGQSAQPPPSPPSPPPLPPPPEEPTGAAAAGPESLPRQPPPLSAPSSQPSAGAEPAPPRQEGAEPDKKRGASSGAPTGAAKQDRDLTTLLIRAVASTGGCLLGSVGCALCGGVAPPALVVAGLWALSATGTCTGMEGLMACGFLFMGAMLGGVLGTAGFDLGGTLGLVLAAIVFDRSWPSLLGSAVALVVGLGIPVVTVGAAGVGAFLLPMVNPVVAIPVEAQMVLLVVAGAGVVAGPLAALLAYNVAAAVLAPAEDAED